jgi:hypothetical protein
MTITDPDLPSCEKCGESFEPRSGSGGSVQRFCCKGCRLSFHKQRLRSERRGAHAGSIAPSGTRQPPQNETPTSEPTITAPRPYETGLDARAVNAISVAAPNYDPIQSCVTILRHSRSDKAGQRTGPRAAYIAPTRPTASGDPPQSETLPGELRQARHPWETGVLDLIDFERVQFALALKNGETAGADIETWPAEVRAPIEQLLRRWIQDNKGYRTVLAITVAAPKHRGIQSCIVILHHVRKGTPPAHRRAAGDSGVPEEPGDV